MTRYKIIISAIWWGGGLAIIAWFLWLTMIPGTFGDYTNEALDWIIPQLVPTMTLTGAVAFAQGPASWKEPPAQVRYAFLLCCIISLFYLLLVAADIAHALVSVDEHSRGAVDSLASWNKILGVFQGAAASAIGVFFVRSAPGAKGRQAGKD